MIRFLCESSVCMCVCLCVRAREECNWNCARATEWFFGIASKSLCGEEGKVRCEGILPLTKSKIIQRFWNLVSSLYKASSRSPPEESRIPNYLFALILPNTCKVSDLCMCWWNVHTKYIPIPVCVAIRVVIK